jgi:hypothetical protein
VIRRRRRFTEIHAPHHAAKTLPLSTGSEEEAFRPRPRVGLRQGARRPFSVDARAEVVAVRRA